MSVRSPFISCAAAALSLASGHAFASGDRSGALTSEEFSEAVAPWLPALGECSLTFQVDGQKVSVGPTKLLPAVFPYGSVSKEFTAVLAMKLVEAGKLRVDDRLSKFAFSLPGDSEITVHELLTHTSGLADYTKLMYRGQVTEAMLVDAIRRLSPTDQKPPGRFEYCNSNYMLLGLICEKLTGKTLDRLYQDDLYSPLGLQCRYGLDGVGVIYGGAGAIAGSAQDLSVWGQAVGSRDARLLSKESWSQVLSRQVSMSPTGAEGVSAYGYGVILDDSFAFPLITHAGGVSVGGGQPGYYSFLMTRNDPLFPASLVMFSRQNHNDKSNNAFNGAFQSVVGLSEAKRWTNRFLSGPSQDRLDSWVKENRLDSKLADLLTPTALEGLRRTVGSLKRVSAVKVGAQAGVTAVQFAATGANGSASIKAWFGKKGELIGYTFK